MCRASAPYREAIQALGYGRQWRDALELFSDMCELDPSAAGAPRLSGYWKARAFTTEVEGG